MSDTKPSLSRMRGFTIVELLMAIALSGVILSVFVSTLLSMVRTATIQKTQLELSQKTQLALDIVERDVRLARAFDTTLAYSPFSDKYGPTNTDQGWTGTWSYKGSDADHRVLILRQSATTTNPLRASRTPVYVDGRVTNSYAATEPTLNCTAFNSVTAPTGGLSYNPPLPYYLIYFVRSNNLYRRTLTDTATTLCNGPQYHKQSCPAIDTTPDTTCLANDELIATDVASFTVAYNELTYSSGTPTVTDIDAYTKTASDIFEEISNVVVTIKLQKSLYGSNTSSTLSVRVSKVN